MPIVVKAGRRKPLGHPVRRDTKMEREAKLITIGNWSGPAFFVDGDWYVRPQSIVESMGFDWVKTRKKLVVIYAEDIILVQRPPGMSGKWKPVLMTVDATIRWLARADTNNNMDAEWRVVAKGMAAAIARQFADLALEKGSKASSEQIVVLGGSHDKR